MIYSHFQKLVREILYISNILFFIIIMMLQSTHANADLIVNSDSTSQILLAIPQEVVEFVDKKMEVIEKTCKYSSPISSLLRSESKKKKNSNISTQVDPIDQVEWSYYIATRFEETFGSVSKCNVYELLRLVNDFKGELNYYMFDYYFSKFMQNDEIKNPQIPKEYFDIYWNTHQILDRISEGRDDDIISRYFRALKMYFTSSKIIADSELKNHFAPNYHELLLGAQSRLRTNPYLLRALFLLQRDSSYIIRVLFLTKKRRFKESHGANTPVLYFDFIVEANKQFSIAGLYPLMNPNNLLIMKNNLGFFNLLETDKELLDKVVEFNKNNIEIKVEVPFSLLENNFQSIISNQVLFETLIEAGVLNLDYMTVPIRSWVGKVYYSPFLSRQCRTLGMYKNKTRNDLIQVLDYLNNYDSLKSIIKDCFDFFKKWDSIPSPPKSKWGSYVEKGQK